MLVDLCFFFVYIIVGQKICFDNLFLPADTNIYNLTVNCNSRHLKQDMAYEVGYGRVIDASKQIFVVRLFRTSQTNK